ncbi:MAG TPA: hypothetical protein VIO61_03375 [Anaerolineaceae bacterium]
MNADGVRLMLGITLMLLALMAVFYLRQRSMAWWEYLLWGMVAVFIPLIGPFVVMIIRPGKKRTAIQPLRTNVLNVKRTKILSHKVPEK